VDGGSGEGPRLRPRRWKKRGKRPQLDRRKGANLEENVVQVRRNVRKVLLLAGLGRHNLEIRRRHVLLRREDATA